MAAAGRRRLLALCQTRLGSQPVIDDAASWLAVAVRLHGLGELEAALAAFETGAALRPDEVQPWLAVATLRAELGRPADALAACNRALALDPEHVGALVNAGLLLRTLADPEAALYCFDKALAGDSAALTAALARAQTLATLQRLDAAAAAFADYLERDPGEVQAVYGLADVELARGNFATAAVLLEVLLEREPAWTAARISLAVAAVGLGDEARADALLAAARQADPEGCAAYRPFFAADSLGGHAILESQRFRVAMEFTALFRCQWRRRKPFVDWLEARLALPGGGGIDDPDIPFVALGLEISPGARLTLARNVASRLQRELGAPTLRRHGRRSSGRIRLGYVSGDLREHPIGRLVSPLFGLHDRDSFEVYVYHTGPLEDCLPRRQAEAGADVFRDVAALSAAALAALLAADGIDVLVDLSGYTLFNRTAALALRPASLQVAYMGYFGTLGASFVDYVLADHTALLPEVRPSWSESIAYLPDTFFLCDDRLQPPAGHVARADFGLPARGFVFACLNATWKIEPVVFDRWMCLLQAVPGSVLWLFDGGSAPARAALVAEAVRRGVDAGRLVFADHAGYADYLRRYQVVDLVLNTLTYNGNTTTVEALAMGVPVLTPAGRELPARSAASILLAHGLPELVATSLDDYEARARHLAEDGEALAALRRRVVTKRAGSRLFCTERRVREIEVAYRMMWARHEAGLPPADFDVPRSD